MTEYSPGQIGAPNASTPNIMHVWRAMNVAVTIPSIAPQTTSIVQVSLPGIQVGDNVSVTLASGSATPPSGVFPGGEFCTTAGTLSIKYGYLGGALTSNSTATNVTLNVLITSAQ